MIEKEKSLNTADIKKIKNKKEISVVVGFLFQLLRVRKVIL